MKQHKLLNNYPLKETTKWKIQQTKINALHFLKDWYEFRLASLHVCQSQNQTNMNHDYFQ